MDAEEDEVSSAEDNASAAQSSRHADFADTWMQRASSFNNVCNRFSRLCDKFTFIPNRELFFDINSYLNNLQVRTAEHSSCYVVLQVLHKFRCNFSIELSAPQLPISLFLNMMRPEQC